MCGQEFNTADPCYPSCATFQPSMNDYNNSCDCPDAPRHRIASRNKMDSFFNPFSLSANPTSSQPDAEVLERLLTVTMPFGKYKGRVIADLPGHYLNWFAREGFPSGELGRLLALMHEIDHNGLKELLRKATRR
jgi:uncharacterized protein (DUF3820 family)